MDSRKHVSQLKICESLQDSCHSSQIPDSNIQISISNDSGSQQPIKNNQPKATLFGIFLAKRSSSPASEFKRPRI
jgi:hypothetical protein